MENRLPGEAPASPRSRSPGGRTGSGAVDLPLEERPGRGGSLRQNITPDVAFHGPTRPLEVGDFGPIRAWSRSRTPDLRLVSDYFVRVDFLQTGCWGRAAYSVANAQAGSRVSVSPGLSRS